MKNNYLVSIIVPIYNISQYLDKCISSIVNQEYQNIEILLIDDGSTDNSLSICNKWKQNDHRILVFHKTNEGLGPTRNYGVERAKGDYLLFVDSDDWIHERTVLELINEVENQKTDAVFFDFTIYTQDKNIYTESFENRQYLTKEENFFENKMKYCLLPSVCLGMYKKDIWIKNKIKFPSLPYEDNAVYPLILILYRNFSILDRAFYFYRTQHGKSITQNYNNNTRRDEPLCILIENFKNHNLFDKHKTDIYNFCINQLSSSLNSVNTHLSEEIYKETIKKFNLFIMKYFEGFKTFFEETILYFGSYNLGRIGNFISKHNIYEDRYNFCSYISLMSKHNFPFNIKTDNLYRKTMLEKEYNQSFLSRLTNSEKKIIVIDLLNERYPIAKIGKASYFTKSEAFDEANKDIKNVTYLKVDKEIDKLFQESFTKFMQICLSCKNIVKIIMVRSFLSENYGSEFEIHQFQNIEEIQKTNNRLNRYYDFVNNHFPFVININIEKQNFYTDEKFPYGCSPENLNKIKYKDIANQILENIDKDKILINA